MRGFFILLLLTNVAFLAWQYLGKDGPQQTDPYRGISFNDKGLTLLSELPADKRPGLRSGEEQADTDAAAASTAGKPPTEEPAAAPPAATTGSSKEVAQAKACYRVGQIEERDQLDKLLTTLKQQGAKAIEQGSMQGQKTNYWVMLPPYGSRDKAAEAAAMLKQQRIRDFFIVRSGDYENAVSLGVFSTRDRAERRYHQVDRLKARLRKPKIEAIQLPAKRYWVSYTLDTNEARGSVDSHLEAMGLVKSEEIACK